jgi:hypothetical protein
VAALVGFPALVAGFAGLAIVDRARYASLLVEDAAVEWATVAGLLAAAALAAHHARTLGAGPMRGAGRWTYGALALACLLVALEEVSWGQRVLGLENPAFFEAWSDQREINAHNVVQKVTGVAMKWPVGLGYATYGALLPLWAAAARASPRTPGAVLLGRLERGGLLVPPLALLRAFLLASLLMLDLPSNDEEELAELLGVLALVVLLAAERLRARAAAA